MTTRPGSVFAMGFVAAVVVLATTYSVKATPQTVQAQDPLTALLGEVHALRIAMEQSATVAPRVQLTLARLNIEEQRIAQLAAQVDQVRRELTAASLESQKLAEQVPEVEKGLQTAPDDKTRRGYEYEQVALKQKMNAQSRLEQQLRTRENESAQALGTEQSRWIDLNARLDELERLLGPVPR
jgi:chromosome segregation ATPase